MSLFARLLAQPDPPSRLIVPDPVLGRLRLIQVPFFILAIFLAALFISICLMNLILFRALSLPPSFLALLFLSTAFLANICFLSVLSHYWKHIEAQRFSAAQQDQHLLADEQPQPNANALQVPILILTHQIVDFRFRTGYVLVMGLLFAIYAYFFLPSFFPFSWLWSLMGGVLAWGLVLLIFVLITRVHYRIEVTGAGIKTRTHGGSMVFWHEMRLFACYPEPGPWRNSPALIYELSSASHVIRWQWVRRKSWLYALGGKPAPGFEEHNAQMQALCALAAGKTGLPLYDLSKGFHRG